MVEAPDQYTSQWMFLILGGGGGHFNSTGRGLCKEQQPIKFVARLVGCFLNCFLNASI